MRKRPRHKSKLRRPPTFLLKNRNKRLAAACNRIDNKFHESLPTSYNRNMSITRQQALDYFHSDDLIGLGMEADASTPSA
jgi:hypothetical protein